MKQGKADSLVEISANGDNLTTLHSTHDGDPAQSHITLGGHTDSSQATLRPSTAANGLNAKQLASAVDLHALASADKKTREGYLADGSSSTDGKDSITMDKLKASFDQSQLVAIQELMVDMSIEERQKFMSQINAQVANEGRLDSDTFYRQGGDINSFIKESDQRERLENHFARAQGIPLGPQGEEDSAQFEEIFKQMQKQMESESKNDSSEMDEHHGEIMRNIMGQMGLTQQQQDQLIQEELRNNQQNSEAILNNYMMSQMHENQQRELMMQRQMREIPYELQLMQALGASSPEEAIAIMQATGLKQEDIPRLLMERQLEARALATPPTMNQPPPEPVKLTRKQQLGIEPIPPELQRQLELRKQYEERMMIEQEMILAQGNMQNGAHPQILPAGGMPEGMAAQGQLQQAGTRNAFQMAPLRMKMPPALPHGLTKEDFDQLPPEQQLIIQQQMIQANAAKERAALEDMMVDQMMMPNDIHQPQEYAADGAQIDPANPKKIKPKRYKGLLEWICDREGHEFLIEVDRAYIRNPMSHIGLMKKFYQELNIQVDQAQQNDRFELYLKHLYKAAAPTAQHLQDEKYLQFIQDAVDLYGLIHSRYIRTSEGMAKVVSKYLEGIYGLCPRALCSSQKCLPVGLSDKLRSSRVKIFCPKCDEVYMVQKYKSGATGQPGGVQTATNLDGAYFGSSFPQIFITWQETLCEQPPKVYYYEPQISGFKVVGQRGSKFYNPAKTCAVKRQNQAQGQVPSEKERKIKNNKSQKKVQ